MLDLICEKCEKPFSSEHWHGYYPECVKLFREHRHKMARAHNPAPGIHLDGQFAPASDCPKSFLAPDNKVRCGLCGSEELDHGYGLGTGYGIGVYNFCCGCNTGLDFVGDDDESDDQKGGKLVEAPQA